MKRNHFKLLIFPGDIIATFLLFFYIFVFHFLSFGSFLLDSSQDEMIVMNLSEWILPIIIVGTLTYLYIKYLWGKEKYKKLKVYFLIIGFGTSTMFNVIWALLHLNSNNPNNLYVQLFALVVNLLLLSYTNSIRKKLLS
ncbi:hypothetical protein IM538_13240 [Cytobacillus suaedae]|nr:hypothetical protein IM538_13240 [Cytobacillus suaedae]